MSDLLQNSGPWWLLILSREGSFWVTATFTQLLPGLMEKNPRKISKGLDGHARKENSAPAKIMNHKLMAHSKNYSL